VFPILGYSYFEYANSLKESDPFSALLYSEYALELSNLDIYFKSHGVNGVEVFENIDKKLIGVLVAGIVLGIFVAKIFRFKIRKRNKKPKRRKK
jgi:hypothetical protein